MIREVPETAKDNDDINENVGYFWWGKGISSIVLLGKVEPCNIFSSLICYSVKVHLFQVTLRKTGNANE